MRDSEDLSFSAGLTERNDEKLLIGYLPSLFVTMAFPLRDTKKNIFKRSYNGRQMMVSNSSHVPFGAYGRNLLSILTTHAVALGKDDEQSVEVFYDTLSDLVREMNLPMSRGPKVVEQLECFSDCTFIFKEEKVTQISELPFEDDELKGKSFRKTVKATGTIPFLDWLKWESYEDGYGNRKNRAFSMRLSSQFVKFCRGHAVPINYSVYSSIKAPACKDLYVWCCYRNNSIEEDKPIFIPKEMLVEQFMPVRAKENYNQVFHMNYEYICNYLREIRDNYYKGLRIEFQNEAGGILFHKSKVMIEENDRRFMLLTGFRS